MKTRARVRTLISLAISGGLLFYLYRAYVSEAVDLDIRWTWFAAGAVLTLAINYGVGALKWHWVLRLHGIDLPRRDVAKMWVGLYPVAFLFPFQTGHLLYARAVEKQAGTSFGLAFRAMVFDKGLNLLATLLLIACGQLLLDSDHPLSHPLVLLVAATPVVAFVGLNLRQLADRLPARAVRLRGWLKGLELQLSAAQKLRLLVVAGAYQSTDVISAVVAGLAINSGADPIAVLGVFPVIVLLSYVPAAFEGFGAREALSVLWLTGAFTQAEAVSLGFLVSMAEYAIPAAIGLVFLRYALSLIAGSEVAAESPD